MPAVLNKPHNGCLAALFPEVTHVESFRKELDCTFVFDGNVFDFTVVKVRNLTRKVQSGSL